MSFARFGTVAPWQWLFVLEALPVYVFSALVLITLVNSPALATWLTPAERSALTRDLGISSDNATPAPAGHIFRALTDPSAIVFSVSCFLIMACGTAFSFFIPLVLQPIGMAVTTLGFLLSVQHMLGAAAHIVWGWWSDKASSRPIVCAIACIIAAGSCWLIATFNGHPMAIVFSMLAQIGINAAVTSFWTLPMTHGRRVQISVVIAAVTAIGNMGGIVSPYVVGRLRDMTGGYSLPLVCLGVSIAAAAALIVIFDYQCRPKLAEQ